MEKREMEFKVGMKIAKKDGSTFSNNKKIATIDRISGDCVWLFETGFWLSKAEIVSVEPKSPIQEEVVTKRKLVPGVYGHVIVNSYGNGKVVYHIDRSVRGATAEELEEASHILAQLAEFLRSEEK